jgi:hypothetical protein
VRRAIGIALLGALAAGAAGCGAAPLRSEPGNAVWAGDVRPHAVIAFGIPLARYSGHRRLVVLGFGPAHAREAKGLHLRYGVTTTVPGAQIGSAAGWKPRRWGLHPVPGYVIRHGWAPTVVVGMAADGPGMYGVRDWVLDYVVGGEFHRAHYGPATWICIHISHCSDS